MMLEKKWLKIVTVTFVWCIIQTDTELFYKFSPVLMQHISRQTVTAWIEKKRKLDPRRLIPALVHYHQQGKSTQVSRKIEYRAIQRLITRLRGCLSPSETDALI